MDRQRGRERERDRERERERQRERERERDREKERERKRMRMRLRMRLRKSEREREREQEEQRKRERRRGEGGGDGGGEGARGEGSSARIRVLQGGDPILTPPLRSELATRPNQPNKVSATRARHTWSLRTEGSVPPPLGASNLAWELRFNASSRILAYSCSFATVTDRHSMRIRSGWDLPSAI